MMARYTNTNVNLESRNPWISSRKVPTIASNSNHRNPKQTTRINSKTRMRNSSEENRSHTVSTKNLRPTRWSPASLSPWSLMQHHSSMIVASFSLTTTAASSKGKRAIKRSSSMSSSKASIRNKWRSCWERIKVIRNFQSANWDLSMQMRNSWDLDHPLRQTTSNGSSNAPVLKLWLWAQDGSPQPMSLPTPKSRSLIWQATKSEQFPLIDN